MTRSTLLLHLVPLAGLLPSPSIGQDASFEALLAARRDQIALEAVEAEHARSAQLARDGLVSAAELERRRADVATARLDLQRSLAALIDRSPYVTADRALKRRLADGRQVVTLTLRNRTPELTARQRAVLREVGGAELEQALLDVRTDAAFVAIESNVVPPTAPGQAALAPIPGRTTIALPYEARLPALARGEATDLTFQLLRDATSVVVAIRHPRGDREIAIELEQADTEEVASFSTTQHSLEADLGTQATFSLTLERASVAPRTFRLEALGLPPAVDARFVDPGGSRVSRLHFPAGVQRQVVGLEVLLPERPSDGLALDRGHAFWVVAADAGTPSDRDVGGEALLEDRRAARLELAILPRGVPALDLRAGNLFAQIDAGTAARSELRLRNTGSRRLDQIALRVDAPPGWQPRLEPASVAALEIGEEAVVTLVAAPPAAVESGEVELRLITEVQASNRPVPVADKVFRVRITPRGSMVAGIVTSALLLLIIAAVVVFGVRLARR